MEDLAALRPRNSDPHDDISDDVVNPSLSDRTGPTESTAQQKSRRGIMNPKNAPASINIRSNSGRGFMSRVWEISIQSACAGWHAQLRICNIVPYDAPILTACYAGNYLRARRLIENGEASPQDCTSARGSLRLSPLFVNLLLYSKPTFSLITIREHCPPKTGTRAST